MEDSNIILFFGRFHPLLVHLPIGFLIMAALMELAERLRWLKHARAAIVFALLLGVTSAIGASVLGYMLGTSGDYSPDMLDAHMWAGFVTIIVSALALLFKARWSDLSKPQTRAYLGLLGTMMIALSATGHLGGNMTHGADYLTRYAPFFPKPVDPLQRPPVKDVQFAQLFGDVVHPIIRSRCISCHNDEKKKGKLSLATIDGYMKGGESGHLIVNGRPGESELFKRISLPVGHEDIMPPDGKEPLTKEEKLLIEFWIGQAGGSFDTLISQVQITEEALLAANQLLGLSGSAKERIALDSISPAEITRLRSLGFEVRELVDGSNALDVTLPAGMTTAEDVESYLMALNEVKNNIVWLSIVDNGLEDTHLHMIADFKRLRKLKLSKNNLTDEGIARLAGLSELKTINLYGTQVTHKCLEDLMSLQELERVYIWETGINSEQLLAAREQYPSLTLIGGS